MIASEKKRIRFIGDIAYAQTNKERYLGYLKAMQRHQLFINESENLTQSMGLDQYKPLVYEYLDHIAASSDAIVCVNDHIASLVLAYCQEHNIRDYAIAFNAVPMEGEDINLYDMLEVLRAEVCRGYDSLR